MYVWGTGKYLEDIYDILKKKYKIEGFIDNNPKEKTKYGIQVFKPSELDFRQIDQVFVASSYIIEIFKQLIEYGISVDKIFSEIYKEDETITYFINSKKEIVADFNECNFLIENEESKILFESIVLFKEYDVAIEKETILFDLGMNRGFTSIYIGKNELVKKIYGYEPFGETVKLAHKNLEMNKDLINKIVVREVGIGSHDEYLKVKYNPEDKWGMSTIKNLYGNSEFDEVEIEIKDVYGELNDKIDRKYQNILKMDIEGAEYSVIKRMEETDILCEFDIIILEWHYEGSKKLISTLRKNGFITIEKYINSQVGLIYGIKK